MNVLRLLALTTAFSAVLYAAILLFRKLFAGRISAAVQYGIWFLLVLRLLLPFTIDSGIHLITLPGPAAQFVETLRSGMLASAGSAAPWAPVWADRMLAAWAAGAAIFFAWFLAQYVWLARRVSREGQSPDAAMQDVFLQVKAELGIRRGPKVAVLGGISTPALTAGPAPRLLLPSGPPMLREELADILRHELTHYKRGDHIVCLLLAALRCVYWFNPVVWLAFRQMRLDMEISCDSLAVRNMDMDGRKRYASMMLSMFSRPQNPSVVMGMGMESNRNNIEKRIRGVFMNAKSKNVALILAAASAMALILACFTTACVPALGESNPPSASAPTSSPLAPTAPPALALSPAPSDPNMIAVYDSSGNVVDYAYCLYSENGGGVVMCGSSLFEAVLRGQTVAERLENIRIATEAMNGGYIVATPAP